MFRVSENLTRFVNLKSDIGEISKYLPKLQRGFCGAKWCLGEKRMVYENLLRYHFSEIVGGFNPHCTVSHIYVAT